MLLGWRNKTITISMLSVNGSVQNSGRWENQKQMKEKEKNQLSIFHINLFADKVLHSECCLCWSTVNTARKIESLTNKEEKNNNTRCIASFNTWWPISKFRLPRCAQCALICFFFLLSSHYYVKQANWLSWVFLVVVVVAVSFEEFFVRCFALQSLHKYQAVSAMSVSVNKFLVCAHLEKVKKSLRSTQNPFVEPPWLVVKFPFSSNRFQFTFIRT